MNNNSFFDSSQDQEVKLFDLIKIILDKKYKIILFTTLISIVAFLISIQLTPIYKSDALLEIITENDNDIPDLGAYGGLAAMAGVDIGSQEDKAFLIEETVKSRLFLSHLISIDKTVLQNLYAANGYDPVSKQIKYDKRIYDTKNQKWTRKVKPPYKPEPSLLEVHEIYIEDIVSVSKDKLSGFIILEVEHPSPFFAKQFLEFIIKELNNTIRLKDLNESTESIEFLTKEVQISQYAEIKNSINSIIKTQLQKKMISNIRQDYIVRPIDTPQLPQKKVKPKKATILVVAFMAAFISACLFFILRQFLVLPRINND